MKSFYNYHFPEDEADAFYCRVVSYFWGVAFAKLAGHFYTGFALLSDRRLG